MDEQVSLKELRTTFYQCRDFELSHLWQRSIFLTAFIVLCFTGYGQVLIQMLEKCSTKLTATESLPFHVIASGIALVGIIFSIIWIMMAKASKTWYEVYEKVICEIEWKEGLGIPEKYIMGEYLYLDSNKRDSNILTCKAGKYSPSKLNIVIGIVLLFVWAVIFVVHMIKMPHTLVFYLLAGGCLVVIFTAVFNLWAKSSSLG